VNQQIVNDKPPLYDRIIQVFPNGAKHGVLFSWGDVIYNPSGITISQALLAHEDVHGQRQVGDIEGWWEKYLTDPEFRLREEFLAHCAEIMQFNATHARHMRRAYLVQVAGRLSGPLYGNLISFAKAKSNLAAACDALLTSARPPS
jgi:hypothetical protein